MGTDARPSRKGKNDASSSRTGPLTGKGSSTSGSATTDTYGLRRSVRETPSRKQTNSSPLTTRKSERLEKKIPVRAPVKKKSMIAEKLIMSTPLRRSDRSKKHQSPSPLGSKTSEQGSSSSDVKIIKLKGEKARQMGRREKPDPKPVGLKNKRMDARTFKSFFKHQLRGDIMPDFNEELGKPDKTSQVDSRDCGDSVPNRVEDGENRPGESNESLHKTFDATALGNCSTVERSCSSPESSSRTEPSESSNGDCLNDSACHQKVRESIDDVKRVCGDCSVVEKFQTPKLAGFACTGRSLDDSIGEKTGDGVASKRKRCRVERNCETSATFASKDVSSSNKGIISPQSLEGKRDNLVRDCVRFSKRQRIDYRSLERELSFSSVAVDKHFPGASSHKDRGEIEGGLQRLSGKNDGTAQLEKSSLDVQVDVHKKLCFICKIGGELLFCAGKCCTRSYHPSCLELPLTNVLQGPWYCFSCVRKMIELDVYSVSEGVESIWDVKVELTHPEDLREQKQYFVKYKGLAHVHNRWVTETELLLEAPLLVSNYKHENQVTKWKEEWTVPQRLLGRMLLRSLDHQDDISDSYGIRLVKWRGLDYKHASWELEDSSFLLSPEAQSLVTDYENRCQRAKEGSSFSPKVKGKRGPFVKLSKLPNGITLGMSNNKLNSLNKMREYWHKGQNAIIINDQERMAKVVLYILSLVSDVSQPFLIVSNPSSLSLWEAEFSRLAPSANVVVYNGDKDNRTIIRAFEFCVEVGCVMCQVLLSSIEAVLEDLEMMECLRWEAVIIDECQQAVISEKFEEIKKLSTEVRILLYNNQLKENIDEHLNLLSLLDHCTDLDTNKGSNGDLDGAFGKLRERLSQFIAYESQSVSSRYLEYWVPVMISNVQLEQYCATLLANSTSLLSYSKSETIGALREILISTRKCCDHPYIVDQSLQGLLTEGLPGIEYLLDVGIKASGKLHLLDTILSEIKNQGLRVVILFQSIGGSGRDSIGDILDDFIRQRFGPDSYERVDGGVLASKKQAALNKFNDKGTGIFVFLLENRACGHSIRISSVDAIILFDSDWNPAHDLKALKRISADSSMKQIKIFRLYSACTVEESVLNLATQEVTLDSNFLSISRGTIHMLLMWGASYLFSKLDKFHCGNTSTTAGEESSDFPLQEVAKEFMALLYRDDQNAYLGNSQIIRVQHVGGKYIKDVPLFGELKIQSTGGEEPMLFWRKLLGGRNPRWKYSSGPLKRNRKRVRNFHESPKKPLDGTDEVVKKRKRLVNNTTGSASPRAKEKGNEFPVDNGGVPAGNSSQHMLTSTAVVNGTRHIVNTSSPCIPSNGITPVSDIQNNGPEEGILLHKGQKDLHDLLKSEISKLSEILRLSEDVKVMVGRFLEYIFDNHHVNREPLTILQAFQISLCWIASSLLKCKIDKKESLALAKQHLNFGCSVEEATNVYSKLHLLKKSFLSHVDNFKESESSKDSTSAAEDIMKELPDGGMFQPMAQSLQNVKVELEDRSENQASAEGFSQQEVAKHKVMEKLLLRSLERTQKKNEERIKELIRKQQDQIQEFNKIWEGKREALEEKYRAELTIVRTIYRNSPLQLSKIKTVEDGFAKQMEELNILKGRDLKELQKSQLNERNQEREKAADRLEEIKSRQKAADRLEEIKSQQQAKLSGDLPLYGTEPGHTTVFRVHNSPDNVATMSRCLASEHTQSVEVAPSEMHTAAARPAVNSGVRLKTPSLPQCRNDGTGAATSKSGCLVEEQGPIVTQAIELAPCQMQAAASSQAVDCSVSLKTPSLPPYSNREKDAPASKASEKALVAGFEQHNLRSCIDAPEDNVLVSLTSSQEEIQDGTSCREKDMPESAPYKLVVGVDFPGIADSNIDSNMEHNSVLDPMAINNNAAGSSISSGTVSSMVNSPVVEPGVTAAPDGLLSQNLVPQDECGADSSTCIRVHDADAAICGEESVLRQAEVTLLHSDDAGATNQTNQELVNGHGYQLQLPVITDLHVDQNHPDPCAAPGADLVVSEAETPCQGLEAPNLVDFQCAANIMSSPPHAIDEPIRQEHPEFHLADRNDNQPRSEGSISFQNADNSFQIFVTSGLPSQNSSGTQLGASRAVDTPLGGSGTPIMVHSAPYMASRMPNQLYIDPLQNELERLHKDIDQAIKCHEETKLQLKSDCDREIEETIAAIRRKYEAKLQEAENAFLQKKNALDTNQNKVYMNKILAETFQFKCLDLRQSGASRVCQVAPSNMMLQPHVLSPSQVAPSLSPVTGLTGAPPIQVVQNSSELISTMPTRSQPVPSLPPISGLASVSSTAANQLTGAPPVQIVQNSPVLMSNMPTRPPPLIASITRPTGNSQVIGEIRAPAPHLQPFGPPSTPPMTIPPLPRVLPSQQAQRNSPTVPQVLPRGPPPPPPPPPMYQSSQNALSSALGLTDNSNQGGANPPNILPPLQDLGINFGPLDLSQFGTPQTEGGSGRSNMACSAAETDVVCLSDDD